MSSYLYSCDSHIKVTQLFNKTNKTVKIHKKAAYFTRCLQKKNPEQASHPSGFYLFHINKLLIGRGKLWFIKHIITLCTFWFHNLTCNRNLFKNHYIIPAEIACIRRVLRHNFCNKTALFIINIYFSVIKILFPESDLFPVYGYPYNAVLFYSRCPLHPHNLPS